jgi:hypothetical protein
MHSYKSCVTILQSYIKIDRVVSEEIRSQDFVIVHYSEKCYSCILYHHIDSTFLGVVGLSYFLAMCLDGGHTATCSNLVYHKVEDEFRSRGMFCLQELIDGSALKHLK